MKTTCLRIDLLATETVQRSIETMPPEMHEQTFEWVADQGREFP